MILKCGTCKSENVSLRYKEYNCDYCQRYCVRSDNLNKTCDKCLHTIEVIMYYFTCNDCNCFTYQYDSEFYKKIKMKSKSMLKSISKRKPYCMPF